MSSETITRNDLTNILNEVLPPTPSEYKKLLWTNPSPTSAFNAQDVNLDLSDYDAVDIECKHWSNDNTTSTTRTEKGEIGTISITSNSNGHIAVRDWGVYADRVYFGTGKDLFGTSLTNPSNSACVPYKIYGIKYERVNPPQVETADCVIEQGTSGIWKYRKWNSGKIEAFASNNWGGIAGSVWVAPIYYRDLTLSIPSGIFPSTPTKVYATGSTNQWSIWGAWATSATQISLRCTTCATSGQVLSADFYVIYEP